MIITITVAWIAPLKIILKNDKMKLFALCCLASFFAVASAESMVTAFSNFRDKKANQHQLPDDVRGVVCETSGSDPKSYCCNNKNGVR
jgi:hypothetical protein